VHYHANQSQLYPNEGFLEGIRTDALASTFSHLVHRQFNETINDNGATITGGNPPIHMGPFARNYTTAGP